VTPDQFASHYWTTLKPIIEELWKNGHQTLFYAEGNWDHHLDAFAELPDRSIVYHVDRGDIVKAHRAFGEKFCLSGGLSNVLLAMGTPEDVRTECRLILDAVARDGGYVMDASAIMQNDTKIENLRAMTEITRELGTYSGSPSGTPPIPPAQDQERAALQGMNGRNPTGRDAGVCVPWEEKKAELPGFCGDPAIVERIWKDVDGFGNMFIWQCLLSF
jgi:hypothetical protein